MVRPYDDFERGGILVAEVHEVEVKKQVIRAFIAQSFQWTQTNRIAIEEND